MKVAIDKEKWRRRKLHVKRRRKWCWWCGTLALVERKKIMQGVVWAWFRLHYWKKFGPKFFYKSELLQILTSLKKNFILENYLKTRTSEDIELVCPLLAPKFLCWSYDSSKGPLQVEWFCYRVLAPYDQWFARVVSHKSNYSLTPLLDFATCVTDLKDTCEVWKYETHHGSLKGPSLKITNSH